MRILTAWVIKTDVGTLPLFKDVVQYGHGGRMMPAIWFRYDLSPITVRYKEKRKPFYTFLTTVSYG